MPRFLSGVCQEGVEMATDRRIPVAGVTAAVVIWTLGDPDPGPCLESLAPQVDELVLVANPGGAPAAPDGTLVLRNNRTLGFGANINRGVEATEAPFVAVSNPDVEATPGAIATLREFTENRPRC